MANILNQPTVIVDTEGILFIKPVCIKLVRMHRAAFDDAAIFTYWDENGTPDHHFEQQTATWSTLTLTITGVLVAGAPAANDIVHIYKTSTANNQFRFQCATAGDNNDAIFDALNAHHGAVTDEASKVYNLKIWTPKTAFQFAAGTDVDAEQVTDEIPFGDKGHWFPNLAMHTLSSGVTLELFLR